MGERPFVIVLLMAAPLLAQNAEISGFVTDPSGLAVPEARTGVRSAATGETRAVATAQQGEYSAAALLPGVYDFTVAANGFKTVYQKGVKVEVGHLVFGVESLPLGAPVELELIFEVSA